MIIKKKYSTIKKVIDEAPEEDTLSVIDDVVQTYEDEKEEIQEEFEEEENIEPIEEISQDEEIEKNEEEEKKARAIQDLDLSLQNIKFEQREERREGTRRRGYRRSQDRNIVTRAQQDAISIKEMARKEGYNEGIKNAENDLFNINEKLEQFFDCKQEVYDKVSDCILDIAVEIAKKIIHKEVNDNKEYIIPLIKELIEDINKNENKITLKVMPKDVEIVKDKITEIFSSQYFEAKISVVPDNSIKDGGVVVETSNGIIDASIDTQLAIIEEALKKPEVE